MTLDEQRQKSIRDLTTLIDGAMTRWDKDGCFHARGQADGYTRARDELIRGRGDVQTGKGWVHVFDALPAHLKVVHA